VTAYLDAGAAGSRLVYRGGRNDDMFQPLGSDRTHNLMRYLKSQRIADRRNVGVVVSENGHIAWIPRLAVSQTCRITSSTSRIIKISFQPLSQY
jgi:hypothetical protein